MPRRPKDKANFKADWKNNANAAVVGKKIQCQFTIGIEEESEFKVVRKLLGSHGSHVKSIAEESGAKLRLRGRGSGFLEGPNQVEASDPLMLCISVENWWGYEKAKHLVWEHIENVYKQYRSFCASRGIGLPDLEVSLNEGAREGSF